ncbi:MAG: hypothetical protein QOJ99_6099 [Bryobacterales bacterium]|nr:hypothetical protein [Bryobacterales bacterium]
MRNNLTKGVILCLAAFVPLTPVLAQSDRGTITGTVSDPAGAVVPNAAITATNSDTQARFETTSTSTGNYTLVQLPAGVYDLETVSPGFSKAIQKGIRVQVAAIERIDVKLQISSSSDSVTVVADAPLLKTESGEQSSNITTEKILALPLYGGNGRNSGGGFRSPYAFLTTMASATIVPSGGNNSIRVNGLQNDTYSTRIEGQEATNTQQPNASHINPGVEAIEEVTLQTSNFAAEYGEIGGGLINFTAKSGTNRFHGSAFEYLRNEFLNAGQPFTDNGNGQHVRARTRSNDYGFSIGGPVWIPKVYNGHNRTFFNFNLEAAPGTSTASSLITVPSAAFRNGDFSSVLTNKSLGADVEGRTIRENTIYDPSTNHTVGGVVSRDPFPGNIIPPSRFDPVAVKIQNLIPLATAAGNQNNFQQNFSGKTGAKLFTTKVDHNLSANSKLAFYYSHRISNGWTQPDDLPIPITAVRRGTNNNPTVRLNYYQNLRPTLILNVGIGFIRNLNPDPALDGVLEYDAPGKLGFVGGATTYFTGKAAVGFPRITGISGGLGGAPNLGPVNANIYNSQKPSAVANLTWVKNNHTFKFGGEWRKDAHTDRNVRGSQGILNFNTQQTALPSNQSLSGGNVGFAYASFLLGLADSGTVSTAQDPQFLKTSWGAFAQDSWKVTSRLTLELGVRYDFQSGLRELWDRLGSFDPRVPNPSAGGLPGGMAYAGYGTGRCNCQFAPGYRYGFQPRLGFAYRFGDKTVIRGGWGIAYGQTANFNYISNVPIVGVGFNQLSFNRPSFGEPAFTLQGGLPYNPASLNAVSLNPGIRPNPGQVDAPPYWLDPNGGRPPRINQWSIGVQREITNNLVIEASYVGNRAAWLQATALNDLNAVTPESLKAKGIDFTNATDRALLTNQLGSSAVQARGFKAPYAGFPMTQSLLQALKPYPQFSSIPVRWSPLGDSWYDSLQTKVTKRYSHGLDVSGGFTWQKELSLGADPGATGTVNDVFNRQNQKSISPQSTPFVLVIAANYQTPAWGSSRLMRLATGGWTIGTVLRYQSALPIAVPLAQNSLGTQLGRGTLSNRVAGQPLFLNDPNCRCYDPSKDLILNPKAWSDPAPGQWGVSSAYYNDYRGFRRPSEQIVFGRTFRLHESIAVEVQAMFFNALNRTYLNVPDSTNALATKTNGSDGTLTGGFGRINTGTTAFGPRDGVLNMRVHF